FAGGGDPPPPAWLLAGWLASRLGWRPETREGNGLVFRSDTGRVTLAMSGAGRDEGRAIERVRISAGDPHPLEAEIRHEGKQRTARMTKGRSHRTEMDVPFDYRELAACIVGEIHRHAANRPME